MKNLLIGVNAIVGATLLTLVLVVGSWMVLMLTTGAESTRKEGLFGAVAFESVASPTGGLSASMELGSVLALTVLFLVMVVFVLLVQITFLALRSHRRRLLADGAADAVAQH